MPSWVALATADRSTPGFSPRCLDRSFGFHLPDVTPDRYAFVVFCNPCYRGRRGSLIADTSDPNEMLRVRPIGDPRATADGGAASTPGIVAVAVTVALVIAVSLIFRRQGDV